MKKILSRITITSCLVLLIIGKTESQKLDDFKVTYIYKQLALSPLPKELKTYSAQITVQNQRVGSVISKYDKNVPYEVFEDTRNDMIKKFLVIDGLNKVDNGDVRITLSFGNYNLIEANANHNSQQVTTSTTYTFKFPSKLTVMTGAGKILYDKYLFDDNYVFSTYRSHDARGWDYTNFLKDHIISYSVEMALDRTKQILFDQFSTPVLKKEVRMYAAKGKKLDYSDIDKANDIFGFKILNINENTPVSDYQEKMNEAILSWKTILKEADYTNEKARINGIIAAGLLYNISFGYLIMNDFENASKALNELMSIKIDLPKSFSKDIHSLEDFIKSQNKRFNTNNLK